MNIPSRLQSLSLKKSGAVSKAAVRSFQYGSVGTTCRTISDGVGAAPLLGSKAGERRKTLAETKSFPVELWSQVSVIGGGVAATGASVEVGPHAATMTKVRPTQIKPPSFIKVPPSHQLRLYTPTV